VVMLSLFANNNALALILTFLYISLSLVHTCEFFNCKFLVWLAKSCTTFLMPATSVLSRVSLQTYLARSVSSNVFWLNIHCCIASMIVRLQAAGYRLQAWRLRNRGCIFGRGKRFLGAPKRLEEIWGSRSSFPESKANGS